MRFFVEINLFLVLVRVKYILLHYTEFPPKQRICHKSLKDSPKATKDNQQSHKKFGTKIQLKIWNRFVPNSPPIFSLDCCRPRQFYLDNFYLLDQSFVLYGQGCNNESRKKNKKFLKDLNL